MEETNRIRVHGKIISKKDLRKLWDLAKKEYNILSPKRSGNIKLSFTCTDDSTYESSEESDLLNDDSIVDLKTLKSVNIQLDAREDSFKARLDIGLDQGEYSEGKIIVQSTDRRWLAKVFKDVNDILNAIKPRNVLVLKYKLLITLILCILFGIINYLVFGLSNIFFFFFFLSIYSSWFIYDWIGKLFPSIEFDCGPEHNKREKKKRRFIYALFLYLVIPLVLDFLIS